VTSDLAGIYVQRDTQASEQTLWARAYDGEEWGAWDSFVLTTEAPNTARVIEIEDQTIALDGYRWIKLSDVASVYDPEDDEITQLEIYDSVGGNNWYADGATVDASTGYITSNTEEVWFQRDDFASQQTLWARVYDGEDWGAWDSFVLTSEDTAI